MSTVEEVAEKKVADQTTTTATVVAPPSTVSNRLVRLVSKEGDAFEVELNIMAISELVKMQAAHDDDDVEEGDAQDILLPVVSSLMLARIIEFARHHHTEPMTEYERPMVSANLSEIVQQWYADYINVDNGVLVDLVNAANYMDMTPLRSLCCAAIAVKIKDKTPDEIRANLAMPGSAPFTPSPPTDPVADTANQALSEEKDDARTAAFDAAKNAVGIVDAEEAKEANDNDDMEEED